MRLSQNLRSFHSISKDYLLRPSVFSADMSRSSSHLWRARFLTVLVLAMIFVPAAVGQNSRTKAARSAAAHKSDYPKIRAAIAALEAAKAELMNSQKNFGGRKQDAIDAINDTLKRLRLALQFEKY